jgi:hypothetical protein
MSDTVFISAPKPCDFCKTAGVKRDAKYDFRTSWGPWANGCEMHYRTNRAHTELGTGHGQLLVVGEPPEKNDEEIGSELQEAIMAGDFDLAEDILGDRDIAEFI